MHDPHNASLSITFAVRSAIILDLAVIAFGAIVLLVLTFVPYGSAYIAIIGLPFYLFIAVGAIAQLVAAMI